MSSNAETCVEGTHTHFGTIINSKTWLVCALSVTLFVSLVQMLFPFPPCRDTTTLEKVAEFPHRYLKVVELVGYRHYGLLVLPHVLYLIKNAVALEKFIVDPGRRRKCYPEMDRANALFVQFEADARADAMNYLKPNFPSSIEFVCL